MNTNEHSKLIIEWLDRLNRTDEKAKLARIKSNNEPTISVAEVVTWNHRLVLHDGELYQVHAKKLEISS